MGRSESREKQNWDNRAGCEWNEQESRGGNSEGRNKNRKVNSRAENEFQILLYFKIPVLMCTRFHFLGVFGKLQKATVSVIVSVCLSIHPHGTTQLPAREATDDYIMWDMHCTCWITKATDALTMCINYCFSMVPVVQMYLSVTLYVHCISC